MSWKSNLPKFTRMHRRAVDAGLIAAAQVVVNEVKRGLRGGYTSGDFFTGAAMNSVTFAGPRDGEHGREVSVGTPLMYPLFWELGHMNLFTRKYERKEIWVPAMTSTRERQGKAFQKAYQREAKK